MTNEEAIKHVENMKKGIFLFHPDELYDTIINALKQETVTEFADRCRECGAKYGKLLKEIKRIGLSKCNTNEIQAGRKCR